MKNTRTTSLTIQELLFIQSRIFGGVLGALAERQDHQGGQAEQEKVRKTNGSACHQGSP